MVSLLSLSGSTGMARAQLLTLRVTPVKFLVWFDAGGCETFRSSWISLPYALAS